MTYVSKPMGHRLGLFAPKIEELRRQKNLDDKGFPIPRDEEPDGEEVEDDT